MTIAVLLGLGLIACFGGVVFVGAPYLPTLKPQLATALELAEIHRGQTLLELGCGDGKVLIAAAEKGINVVGYELNPLLVVIAWLRTRRYRKHVRIIWGNFWSKEWPDADAIFVFLLPKYMSKLNAKIESYHHRPVTLVSFAFKIEGKQPRITKNNVYAYDYR